MTDEVGDIQFETLGSKERKLLLTALDIDSEDLYCLFCKEGVDYKSCCIMPSIKSDNFATITCSSPICVSLYLGEVESDKTRREQK